MIYVLPIHHAEVARVNIENVCDLYDFAPAGGYTEVPWAGHYTVFKKNGETVSYQATEVEGQSSLTRKDPDTVRQLFFSGLDGRLLDALVKQIKHISADNLHPDFESVYNEREAIKQRFDKSVQ